MVADVVTDLIPSRVVDIVEEEEEDEGGRIAAHASLASTSVKLKYKIFVNDPLLTVDLLRTKLMQAEEDGPLDASLQHFAVQFGATALSNGTFTSTRVTRDSVNREASVQLTGPMVALLVIGIFMALAVMLVGICYVQRGKQLEGSSDAAVCSTV